MTGGSPVSNGYQILTTPHNGTKKTTVLIPTVRRDGRPATKKIVFVGEIIEEDCD
jgi:hypothetical protein